MWKQREEPPRSTSVPASPAQAPAVPVQTPSYSAQVQTPSYSSTSSGGDQTQKETGPMNEEKASIGKSIVINGELSGSEDLTIEGRVDGKIELRDHILTVGSNGRIKAQVSAKAIVVLGHVTGNLNATEKVDIKESGSVEGDIVSPRVAIADGSHFKGSIDMQKKDQPEKGMGTFTKPESKTKSETPKTDTVPVNGEFARV
jgi:cytoskeletal protein CcmA (bactofilin family)